MKTFDEIQVDDFIYALDGIGFDSKIIPLKVNNIEKFSVDNQEYPNGMCISTDSGNVYIQSFEKTKPSTLHAEYFSDLPSAIFCLENVFVSQKEWIQHLISGYNDKLKILYTEIQNWKSKL